MKKTFRKSLALLLSLMMVVSVFSAGAFTADAITTRVMLNNCDSADGWEPYPGDGLEVTTEKKTEGTGSIRTSQSGGFTQGGPIAGLNLTGIQSISFDFAANTAEALTGPADVAFYLFSGSDYVGYQELNEVDTSKVMAFDVAAIRAGYGKDDESFATITTTPVSTGENFDITNVTGFYFWGCTAYGGDHVQWLDNVVADIAGEPVDPAVTDVSRKINALPETVTPNDRINVALASVAYNALTDAQKAQVEEAVKAKLDAAVAASANVADPEEFSVMLNNCDDSSSWWTFPLGDGEYAEIDNEIKTQGTGSFKYHFGGGVGWGASVNHVDITGIKSLSFDIASDNDGILTQPTEKALLLFSRGNPATFGFQDVFNGDNAIMNDAELVSKIMQFNVNEIAVTLPTDGRTFTTVTATPTIIGDNFDYTDITGFQHWSCANYGGSHTQWIDNVRVNLNYDDYKAAAALIDALPTAVAASDRSAIEAARAAYNALSDVKKALIKNYDKLTAAEAALAALVSGESVLNVTLGSLTANPGQTVNIPLSIDGGSVAKRIACFHVIVDYDASVLTPVSGNGFFTGSAMIGSNVMIVANTNTAEVGAGKAELAMISSEAIGAGNYGTLNFTVASGAATDSSTTVSLTACEDIATEDLIMLTDVRITDSTVSIVKAATPADDVIALINAIGTPVTLDSESKIIAAREAYDALSSEEKDKVTNYAVLTAAETELDNLKKIANVENLINAIGTIGEPVTAENRSAVSAARAAYNALSADLRARVGNYAVLTAAETAIKEYDDRMAAVQDVIAKIAALPDADVVALTDEAAIVAARNAYNNLPAGDMNLVTNITRLTAAELALAELKASSQKVKDCIEAIANLPDPVTLADKDKVVAARALYEALSETEKAQVTNYTKLTGAENTIAELEAVKAVEDKIAAIGTLGDDITADNRNAISAARAAYDQLAEALRPGVKNYADLTAAEAAVIAYDARMAKVNEAIAAIDAIGTVGDEVTEANRSAVAAAEEKVAAVDEKDIGKITNMDALNAAKAAIAAYDARMVKVNEAIAAIAAIGTVGDEVTEANRSAVAAAEEKVAAVDEKDIGKITNMDALNAAKAAIAAYDARMVKVNEAIAAIAAIGTVGDEVTEANRSAVAAAEEKVAAVDEKDIGKITNMDALNAAKAAIAAYDARMVKVNEAIAAIAAIGTIADPVTEANRSAVAAAEAKVAAVDEKDTGKITNIKVLEDAKAAIAANDKRAEDVANVIDLINGLDSLTYPLTDDARNAVKAARDAFNALDQIGKDRVTNIARLTEAEELVRLFDNLGNVDEDDKVDTNDALLVLQFTVKSKTLTEWQRKVADVNGDGKVTAVDAMLILQYTTGKITTFPYGK